MRVAWMERTALWCDEAESSINALAIQQTGFPIGTYLDLPVYENTLTEPWEGHPEYEFRDSSYSPQGFAVYHGWLPLYAIAASQILFGLKPDVPHDPPRVLHGVGDIGFRTVVPRLPALVFAVLCMAWIFFIGRQIGGDLAGFAALTLMAFNAKTVDFGYQARYYSLTLLMTVLAAWCLLRVARRGGWRDFLALAVAEGLLFHTHQFSALVFAGTAVLALPVIVAKERWPLKCLAAGALSAAIILPWVWFSGFLFTASHVPKAHKLFDSTWDWLAYTLNRPDQLALLAAVVFLLVIRRTRPAWLPARVGAALDAHGAVYVFLLAWLVIGYAGFHLVVPAASFFYERLSLVLWTPYVLLISVFFSDLLRPVPPRWAGAAGVAVILVFLIVRGRLVFFENPSVTGKREAVAEVISALQAIPPTAGTRFYATPNEHLTYTYYTGLPVQSVAPVRKSFFDASRVPLVFIESQMELMYPRDEDLESSAAAVGRQLTAEELHLAGVTLWEVLASRELVAQGFRPPEAPQTPDFLQPALESTARRMEKFRHDYRRDMKLSPVFRRFEAERIKDFWMGFFYSFANPETRIGEGLNLRERLKSAQIDLLPVANTAIYIVPPATPDHPER